MKCMKSLSQFWRTIQYQLVPMAEQNLGVLSEKHKKLIAVLELIRIEQYLPSRRFEAGRPRKDRQAIARAFIAKVKNGVKPDTMTLRQAEVSLCQA